MKPWYFLIGAGLSFGISFILYMISPVELVQLQNSLFGLGCIGLMAAGFNILIRG